MIDPMPGPSARPGRPIAAAAIGRLRGLASGLARSRAAAPLLTIETPAGPARRLPGPTSFPALLSGTGNPYSFAEQYRTPGGGRAARPGGRTSALAYEMNSVAGLSGKVARVEPVAGGAWYRFLWRSTGAARTGGGGGGGTIPSCFCEHIPITLVMTSANPAGNYGMFQSCTISYKPTPPEFASLNLGDHIYLSDQSFFDPLMASSPFSYLLTCRYNQFALTRLYPHSPYGSPYRDAMLYTWLVGGYGNTCSPFHLDNGIAFPGSDPSCHVAIDEP